MNRRMHNVFIPALVIAALGMGGFNFLHEAATAPPGTGQKHGDGAFDFRPSQQRKRRKALRRMTLVQRKRHLKRTGGRP
jgi:hypothetical protein